MSFGSLFSARCSVLPRFLSAAAFTLLSLSAPQASAATYRLDILGTDCELCTQLAKSSLAALEGVVRVEMSRDKRQLDVVVRPGVALDTEAVVLLTRRSGYVVKSVKVLAD